MSSDENGEYRIERTENILSGEPTSETRTVRTVTQGEPVVTRIVQTTSQGTEQILSSDGSSTSRIIQGEPTFITRTIRTTSGGESSSETQNFQTINQDESSSGPRTFQTIQGEPTYETRTIQGEPTFITRTIRTTSEGDSSSEIHNFQTINQGESTSGSRELQTTTQGEPTFITRTIRTTSGGDSGAEIHDFQTINQGDSNSGSRAFQTTTQGEPITVTRIVRTTSGGESDSSTHNFQTINSGDSSIFQTIQGDLTSETRITQNTTTQGEPTFITRTIRTTSGGESSSSNNFQTINQEDSSSGSRTFHTITHGEPTSETRTLQRTTSQGEPTFITQTIRTTSQGEPSIHTATEASSSGFETPSADARFERVEQVFNSNPTFQAQNFGETTEGGLADLGYASPFHTSTLNSANHGSTSFYNSPFHSSPFGASSSIYSSGAGIAGNTANARGLGDSRRQSVVSAISETGSSASNARSTVSAAATGPGSGNENHYGRDAAIGAGAIGAGGAVLAESDRSSSSQARDTVSTGLVGGTGSSGSAVSNARSAGDTGTVVTTGNSGSAISNSENAGTTATASNLKTSTSNTGSAGNAAYGSGSRNDAHYGRDAAIAAGVGAAGGAALAEHERLSDSRIGKFTSTSGAAGAESSGSAISNTHGTGNTGNTGIGAATSSGSGNDIHYRRDTVIGSGAGAGGSVLAEHENVSTSKDEKPTNDQKSTGLFGGIGNLGSTKSNSRKTGTAATTSSESGNDHQYGRDAILGGGAGAGGAALAEHERPASPQAGKPATSSDISGGFGGAENSKSTTSRSVNARTVATSENLTSSISNIEHTGTAATATAATAGTRTGKEQNYGRNGALDGAGVAGGAALASHERPTGSQAVQTANNRDIAGISNETGNLGSAVSNSGKTGSAHTTGFSVNAVNDTTAGLASGEGAHYGRDAAIGVVAGAGAAGIASHERSASSRSQEARIATADGTRSSGSVISNVGGPATVTDASENVTTGAPQSGKVHGRDAVLGAGVGTGAAGLAEHDKTSNSKVERNASDQKSTGLFGGLGALLSRTGNSGSAVSESENAATTATGSESEKNQYYGRDAPIGVGAGAGAGRSALAEHEKAFDSNDQGSSGSGAVTGAATGAATGGLLGGIGAFFGLGGSNTAASASGTAAAEGSRNVSSVAAGATAAGNPGTAVSNTGNTTSARTTGFGSGKDQKYGRDAVIGAGVGAAGVAEHERTSDSKAGNTKTATTGSGGVLSSQGQQKSAGTTGSGSGKDQKYSRDAALAVGGVGAAGIGEHERTYDTKAGNAKTTTKSSGGLISNQGQQRSAGAATSSSEKDYKQGRDAALAAGAGAGAAGGAILAHHERELSTAGRNPTSSKFDDSLYERPEPTHSGSSTDYEDPSELKRIQTTKSMRERRALFEPIAIGDRAELKRIASNWEGESMVRSSTRGSALERRDTLAGVNVGDSVLDPQSEDFDPYKWSRMMMRLIDENEVIQRRAGIVWKNLKVCGSGSAINLQKNVGSLLLAPLRFGEFFGKGPEKTILNDFEGVLKTGEMLVVLGRPGSGCSTLLKSLMGELTGLDMKAQSEVHYNGIPQKKMVKQFRGEIVYNQEVDKHFPHLTVGETLEFAARVRTPQQRLIEGVNRESWAKHMAQVVMTIFGLSHTYNTKVGNDFVRGVSGGERKRVSIAEMALAGSPIASWDNSTRGLDAATALEFTKSLRMSANLQGTVHLVAIYQASQAIYDIFDKAVVLYQGRQIYFGPCDEAKEYFVEMGYECPSRQTTGDFLTSVTNPSERKVRQGYEKKVPRTPDEFERYWKESSHCRALKRETAEHEEEFPMGGKTLEDFQASRKGMQARHIRPESPYTVSIFMQIKYCTRRAYQRLWNDKTSTVTTIIGQIIMALIIGSIFYGTPNSTASFFQKGGVLFFAVLLNALIAISEINSLYAQRPIVEKQASYAFYHPFTEAMAGIVADIPVKFAIATCFNIILYFLAGLRREPSQFFIFFLFNFVAILTMSQIYRSIAAATKTVSQALAIAGVVTLAIVIYTGFVIPRPLMHPWFKWISWINPVAYAFEGLFVNELHGQTFACSQVVPSGPGYTNTGNNFICAVAGAVQGQLRVNGDDYLESQFQYSYSHIWRNLGFMFAFMIFFLFVYLFATEFNSATDSSAEVLVFRRGHVPKQLLAAEKAAKNDEEAPPAAGAGAGTDDVQDKEQDEQVQALAPQTDVFTWKDVCYDIKIKGEPRRLLDNVNGWVKPGTLTALMGVSGAGKTTLLDVLAQRVSMGVVTGDMFVSGKPLDESFQRKTGYVQQQDLHLETTTVREALRFSAMLRQPKSVSRKEKYAFVEDVIKMLNMKDFAEAVVGVPGEGLNVEQRKLLTIGVELAAKPALLLFLDEPTSGLDSQSSWAIVAFLRKLADNGQAVLATIHQPSAILFQEFDRLLFLAKGGKTVYFGDIGKNSETLLKYFESNGAEKCGENDNPAEYMLTMVGAGPTGKSSKDWHEVWKGSNEAKEVVKELDRIKSEMGKEAADDSEGAHSEFAMPFTQQLYEVTIRVFQQYWRTPGYIYSKILLGVASALFIGFSFFHADASQQGLQDVIFSIFMITTIFTTLVQQIMPRFILQRDLYEVRERPSKAYSWRAFLIANIFVEIPYQIILGVMVFGSYFYPIYTKGGIPPSSRQGLILLLLIQFFVFASTFAHMLISALPDAETAGNIATLMFSLTLTFNGVFQPPNALPGFWIFMYRVSPLTYLVSAIASTGLSGRQVVCSTNELAIMQPANPGQTCYDYLTSYADLAGGKIYNPNATSDCQYCAERNADQFLNSVAINFDTRWRDYGIGFAYIVFNIFMAVILYYLIRVRKGSGRTLGERFGWILKFFKKDASEEKKGRNKAKAPQDKAEPILPGSENKGEY